MAAALNLICCQVLPLLSSKHTQKFMLFAISVNAFGTVAHLRQRIIEHLLQDRINKFSNISEESLRLWRLSIQIDKYGNPNLQGWDFEETLRMHGEELESSKRGLDNVFPYGAEAGKCHVFVKVPMASIIPSDYGKEPVQTENSSIPLGADSPPIPNPSHTLFINCLISGDPPSKIFTIDISSSKNVFFLKRAIIQYKKGHLGNITEDMLRLWNVSIPFDQRGNLKQYDLVKDGEELVIPTKMLGNVFQNMVNEHCHVIVKAPTMQNITPPTFLLNCLMFGDPPHKIFSIEVDHPLWNVFILKRAIIRYKKPLLDKISEDKLRLWKVSLSVDQLGNFEESRLEEEGEELVMPTKMLENVFRDAVYEDCHVVVKATLPFEG